MWQNKKDKDYKKPIKVTAPEYVSLLMDWIEEQVNDDKIFPTDPTVAFPKKFEKKVETIFKRLFRIYAHIYCSHLEKIRKLGEEAHLNTCFKHFMYFVFEFNLIPSNELVVIQDITLVLVGDEYKDRYPKDKKKKK